jgi:parallel beta-helix repeat protein
VIEDNIVYDNMRVAIYVNRSGYTTVQRNLVYHTTPFFMDGPPPSGIVIATEALGTEGFSTDNRIVNNIVVGGGRCFGTLWQVTTHGGLINTLIAHNTFVNLQGEDPCFYISPNPAHSNTRIENNLFFQESGTIADVPEGPAFHWSHNFWSGPPPAYASGPGDIVGDPLLVRPDTPLAPGTVEADWYRLQAQSPARDAAQSDPQVTEDFFGEPRDSNPDMGAHEFR